MEKLPLKGGVTKPMSMKLDRKKEVVAELNEKFSRAKVVILTDYKGLNVERINDLRKRLWDVDVEYRVVKNSLLTRAADGTGVAEIRDHFTGPSAVALSYTDPVAPAKVLSQFAKENEKLGIRVGVLDGKLLDESRIKALANLPPRETILAQLLGAMNEVPAGFVRAIAGVPRGLVNVLQAIKDQKEAG
jgi:large subunit ribosomal protein L10